MAVAGAAGAAGVAAAAVGLGALYTAHSLRSVMATPPQSEEPATELEPTTGSFDCAGLIGKTDDPDIADGEFYACLRHMLYSSRPLYVHCKDPTWRDDAVIAAVTKKLQGRNNEGKAKVLSRLTVLLTLRCARPFRQKLRGLIRDHVAALAQGHTAHVGSEGHTAPSGSEGPTSSHGAQGPSRPTAGIAEFWSKATVKVKAAVTAAVTPAERNLDRIRHLRRVEVALRATGAEKKLYEPVRAESLRLLRALDWRAAANLTKLARIYGAVYVSPSALLKYMPPVPSPARSLPDATSRFEAAMLTWLGRRLLGADPKTRDAAWKVRDLLFATMRVHYVGYEPEWWGWPFARCVHDLVEAREQNCEQSVITSIVGAIEVLVSRIAEVPANFAPHTVKPTPARKQPRDTYAGRHSDIFAAALGGDTEARALIVSENAKCDELEAHARDVLSREATGPEYTLCADILRAWKVLPASFVAKQQATLTGKFYRYKAFHDESDLPGLVAEMRLAVHGDVGQIRELRDVLDPEQDALVPIPKSALRMIRAFVRMNDGAGAGTMRSVVAAATDMDITGDLELAKIIAEADTRKPKQGLDNLLLRRVDELLFAAKQVELLSDQLAPRAWMTTDEYMRRVAHGVLVQSPKGWTTHVPKLEGKVWKLSGKRCVYVRESLVQLDGENARLSSTSFVQWKKGHQVAVELAELALDAWAAKKQK